MPKNFSRLRKDDNNSAIPSGLSIQTKDDTGTPQTSPLSVVVYSSAVTTLAIPSNAAEMVLYPSDNDLRVSEEATVNANYYVQPQGVVQAYGVAGMDTIYVGGDSDTVTLSFYFILV